ncbi:MAG: hypothetical protein IM638_19435, partial [Bacteroidetes bacterium]|nr:hypothetical protein [Bacteroidota bacterium]
GGNVVANLGVRVSMSTGAFVRLGDDLIEIARREFDSYGSEWIKINPHTGKEMFNPNTGGYVVYHFQHNVILSNVNSQAEFAVAEALANNGEKVKLLSESAPQNIATPDAEIIGKGIFDFKNVNSTTQNAIKTNVMTYVMNPSQRSDAQGLIFNIKENTFATPQMIDQGILDAISTADFNYTTNSLAQFIGVRYSDGSIKIITLNEFRNGARF